MASKEALLEELEILKAENARLKHHSNYFISSEQIDFDSFEESNQNLHELFDSAHDLIQVFSLDEKLLFANYIINLLRDMLHCAAFILHQ